MSQDEKTQALAKYIAQIRGLEAQEQQQEGSFVHTADELKKFMQTLDDFKKLFPEFCMLKVKEQEINPNMALTEHVAQFYGKLQDNIDMFVNLNSYISAGSSTDISEPLKITPLFKDSVNQKDCFGISMAIASKIYHLLDLLGTKLNNDYGDHWTAIGTAKDSYQNNISLVYKFQAPTEDAAKTIIEEYKKSMKTHGIRTWLAYWRKANDLGRVEYTCPFTEILKLMSDESRTNPFDAVERQKAWETTRMLQKTMIKAERPGRPRGKSSVATTIWVEQRMIDILGGETETDGDECISDKYPLNVRVRVLSKLIRKGGFAPIYYKNAITSLELPDVLIAFGLSTRLGEKNDDSNWDWRWLIRMGNLEGAAKKNLSAAKSKVRRKITERLKKAGITEDMKEDKNSGSVRVIMAKKSH